MRPITPILASLSIAALGVASLPGTAVAQDAGACSNEVRRLSDSFPSGGGTLTPQQPGARAGAGMTDAQQQQMQDLMEQARTAGARGDAAGCMNNLNQARNMLRQSGVGSAGSGTARGGSQPGTDSAPDLQGTQAPPGLRGAPSDTPAGLNGSAAGNTLGGTGATTPQSAETPSGVPASPPTAGTPRRNTRDSAVSPGGTSGSTSRGTSGAGGGGSGGSSGGGR
jgi:hypothetical protein